MDLRLRTPPDAHGPDGGILYTRTGVDRAQRWAAILADMGAHRLIDSTHGKPAESVIDWLGQLPQSWLQAIEIGTLDMASCYRAHLPDPPVDVCG